MSVIRVENLKKSIKGKVILEGLSFAVEQGGLLSLDWAKRGRENNLDELSAGRYESNFWNH